MLFLASIQSDGDRSKAERLYYAYRKLMYKVAFDILHDKHLAEDAISEAFVKIIKNLHKIGEENCPRTKNFLVIICRNTAINMYNKRNKQCYYDETIDTLSDIASPSTEELVITKESILAVSEVIKGLKPIYRDVIFLTRVYAYSVKDTAMLLGISEDAVKKRLSRARTLLSEELKRQKILY